jgi:two-component system, OmpR family, sensor histidine kinase KdpD
MKEAWVMRTRLETWSRSRGYALSALSVAAATALFLLGRDDFAAGQWGLLYLLIVVVVAGGSGTGPALLAALLSFFAWDFFFIPPFGTLNVADPKDWLMLLAFLGVGVLMGVQTGRMAGERSRALVREHEAEALHQVGAKLVSETTVDAMAEAVLSGLIQTMEASSGTLYVRQQGGFRKYTAEAPVDATGERVQWRPWRRLRDRPTAFEQAQAKLDVRVVELPTGGEPFHALGEGKGLFQPLASASGIAGILTASARRDGRSYGAEDVRFLASLANLVAIFFERRHLEFAAAEREVDRLKSSLLSSVSHELKTPLTALAATVSNLLENDVAWDEDSVRDELRAIVGDVTRLNGSISNLLDLSRLEAHAWEPHCAAYDLVEVILAGIDALPADKRARVTVDVPGDLPPITMDFAQWARVTQSLLENAFLYAGDDPSVRVGARWTARGFELWVEDNGPGVPLEERDAVFEKFYRGRMTGRLAPSGSGLGLAIAREIVLASRGSIRIEDAEPHGARFVITLPVTDSSAHESGVAA